MSVTLALVRVEAPWPLVLEALDTWERLYCATYEPETLFTVTAAIRQSITEDAWR